MLVVTLMVEVIGYSAPNSIPAFLLSILVTVSATKTLLSFASVAGSSIPAPSPKKKEVLFEDHFE
mgnify:CR=1 FL=1